MSHVLLRNVLSRRSVLLAGASIPVGALACNVPAPTSPCPASPAGTGSAQVSSSPKIPTPARTNGSKLRVLCIGAHPDDPETGCGGTLALYAEQGHDVAVLYLTRGEIGIEGKSPDEAGKIRGAEAERACGILGARALFLGQMNGSMEVSNAAAQKIADIFEKEKPDIVFTQWPLDTSTDHQICGLLGVRAYLLKPRAYPLFFYEVETGTQTLDFSPTVYVDIGKTWQKKYDAVMAHASQNPQHLYDVHHDKMEHFRAREIGASTAEAFCVLAPFGSPEAMPGLKG